MDISLSCHFSSNNINHLSFLQHFVANLVKSLNIVFFLFPLIVREESSPIFASLLNIESILSQSKTSNCLPVVLYFSDFSLSVNQMHLALYFIMFQICGIYELKKAKLG